MKSYSYLLAAILLGASGCSSWHSPWGHVPGNNMPNTVTLEETRPEAGKLPKGEHLASQPLLSSARQWQKVAFDVVSGLCAKNPCPGKINGTDGAYLPYGRTSEGAADSPTGPDCLTLDVRGEDARRSTKFQSVLSAGIIRELVAGGGRVYGDKSRAMYGCDSVAIRTTVVKLSGARTTDYYGGALTALGEGILVIRGVVRRIVRGSTDQLAVGAIALGELAYWLSPAYLTRHPMAEIAVTISQTTSEGVYRAQYTNVYYIDARDMEAYEASGANAATSPEPFVRTEAPLPAFYPATASKVSFSGKKNFGLAGSRSAYLAAAAADGSAAAGSVHFLNSEWHAASVTASGTATDLGQITGSSAYGEAISDSGNVVVGRVQTSPNEFSAARWVVAANGTFTSEILGHGSNYPSSTATAVLTSGDGSVVVANVTVTRGRQAGAHRFVRWANSSTEDEDPLNAALSAFVDAHPNVSCDVEGLSLDGQAAVILCNDDGDGPARKIYMWVSPSKTFDVNGASRTLDSLGLQSVVAVSRDLGAIVGGDVLNGRAMVAHLDKKHIGSRPLSDTHFVPRGISADGRVVFGQENNTDAALWTVGTDKVTGVVSSGPAANMKCVAIVGTFLNGSGLVVDLGKDTSGCGLNDLNLTHVQDGDSAYILAPP